jgi:stearoyl-CoA desaturase (delta-9 desaturase)
LVHVLAILALLHWSTSGAVLLVLMHVVTGCFGISLGYHRLLAHRAYEAPVWVRRAFAVCGALALQGGPLSWVAIHRAHHRHDGRTGDAHAASRGFWWSHIGWVFHRAPNGFRFRKLTAQVPDVASDPFMLALERHHLALNVLVFLALMPLFGLQAALWAVPLRTVIVWHTTWLVNSLAHAAPLRGQGEAEPRNVLWLSLVSYGEGLHRNHHEQPNAASFQKRPGDVDLGFRALRLLAASRAVRVSS